MNDVELTIAANVISSHIPKAGTLEERLTSAMKYAREHESEAFFMSGDPNDDLKVRSSIAAVMFNASEEEKDRIVRSLKPLQMMNAAMQGIPVDFSCLPTDDDLLPIIKIWDATEAKESQP